MSPKVSVIMPVYNAGAYLRAAVDSVLAQTFKDFELILVDDGATDGSGAICDEYANSDSRVIVRHGRNGGICASRNVGMDMARGEWIAFCDHDDFMEPTMLETALAATDGTRFQIVKCDHLTYRRRQDGTIAIDFTGIHRSDCAWRVSDLLTPEDYPFLKALCGIVWDGLFRRDFLEAHHLRFDTSFTCGGEDFDFMTRCLPLVERGRWLARPLYRHYINVGVSTSAGYHPRLLQDFLRSVLLTKSLFPAAFEDCRLRFSAFGEWIVPIIHYVFMIDGCDIPLREQARWVYRYYDEIVGPGVKVPVRGFPAKRRFLYWCVRLRLVGTYIFLKKAIVRARAIVRGGWAKT